MYITHTKHNLKPLVHLDIAQDAHIDFLCTSLLNKKGKKLRTGIKKKARNWAIPFIRKPRATKSIEHLNEQRNMTQLLGSV